MTKLSIIVSNNLQEIKDLISEGFCPVECSIGGESIVDALEMDHHGELSHLESVAIRSYRDHWGARKEDPRFVIAGNADADAVATCLNLAGLTSHPSFDVSGLPPFLHAAKRKDLSGFMSTVSILDTDPIGQNKPEMEMIGELLAWQALTAGATSNNGAIFAAQLMLQLLDGHPVRKPFINAAFASEKVRYSQSMKALSEAQKVAGVLLVNSPVWGFEEWYSIHRDRPSNLCSGWENQVVLAYNAIGQNFTVGCPNKAIAEALFGTGGLKNVFPKLDAHSKGWGGREAVGGSPRGLKMPLEDAPSLAKIIGSVLE